MIATAVIDVQLLIDRLKSISSTRRKRTHESVDLAKLLRQTPTLTRGQREAADGATGCAIQLELQPTPTVAGDPAELRRVFINLVCNAAESSPGRLPVSVRLDSNDGNAVVEVSDHGIGMSEQQLSRCLDPFWTTKTGGMGLGLRTSAEIVRDHGGRLELESAPGEGTTARVVLPLGPASGDDVPAATDSR